LDVLGGLVLEDARRWGEAATEWQRADAVAILDPAPCGPRMHFLTRPRGGSKTSDLAAASLAALVEQFPDRAQGYVFACDSDQAALLIDAAGGFVGRSGLGAVVEVLSRQIVHRRSGAAVTVLAADGASAFGLRPYWQVVDEFAMWGEGANQRRLWEAIVSGVPKVEGSRLIVCTSAGDPAHTSASVLAMAKASSAWRVHEVPGPVEWIGRRRWRSSGSFSLSRSSHVCI
jgi:phage terminase large subunit-like protein